MRTPAFKQWFGDWEIKKKLRAVLAAAESVANGANEGVARDLRPDLVQLGGTADVSLIWGNERMGLAKITQLRGLEVVDHVLSAVALGDLERHAETKKTVTLRYGSARAVLSLDEHGQQKTWLLTGWEEGRPDVPAEVRAPSGTTQRTPTFGRDALGAGLTSGSSTGHDYRPSRWSAPSRGGWRHHDRYSLVHKVGCNPIPVAKAGAHRQRHSRHFSGYKIEVRRSISTAMHR